MNEKKIGLDFIRAFAIIIVFIGHLINKQINNEYILLIERSLSPGLTMSLLGFLSGYLLSEKYTLLDGEFYIKRFSRIYASLFVCLLIISFIHFFLSYDVINQHAILHFMGLSFFMELFQVTNKSSIGTGLWFVTIINIMYLLLPMMKLIYCHKNSKIHLLVIIILCLILNKIMYGTASAFNVIIAFNIGCYIANNSNIELLSNKSLFFYIISTSILLLLSGLSTAKIITYETRTLLLPFYPFFTVPLLYRIGNCITGYTKAMIHWFSSISYEVYILHFYFINDNFSDLFPFINSIYLKIIIAFAIVLPLSAICSKIGIWISKKGYFYLIKQETYV